MDTSLIMRNEQKQKWSKNQIWQEAVNIFSCAYMTYILLALICRGSRKTVKLIQKLSPREELRAPVQRLALSLEKQAGV